MYHHKKKVGGGDSITLREEANPTRIGHHESMNSTSYIHNVCKCNRRKVHRVKGNRNSVIEDSNHIKGYKQSN